MVELGHVISNGDNIDQTMKTSGLSGSGRATDATRIRSVARATQVLLWVAKQPYGVSAREIADAHDLALPTTYHLLNTLVDQGMLTKDSQRRYTLGRSAAILAQAHLRTRAVPDVLLGALRELARHTGETTYLADWGEHDIRVLASVEGRHMVRVAEVATGTYEHGHARANGKLLLAFAAPEVRAAYLRAHPLIPVTSRTVCAPDRFEQELAQIREQGWATDEEEYAPGLSCVAAPVRASGQVIAALGLSVPTERFQQRQAELTAILLETATALTLETAVEVPAS